MFPLNTGERVLRGACALPLFSSHRWRCRFCRCAAGHEKVCHSRFSLRTSAASLSGLFGTRCPPLQNTNIRLSERRACERQAAATNSPSWVDMRSHFCLVTLQLLVLLLSLKTFGYISFFIAAIKLHILWMYKNKFLDAASILPGYEEKG